MTLDILLPRARQRDMQSLQLEETTVLIMILEFRYYSWLITI